MDNKYLEDEYKELEHGDIENIHHPDLENKSNFSGSVKDIYFLNSYGFDEGQQVLHTTRHQKIDLGFHIENHILDVIENVRKNIKGKQDMSNTQDNMIVMDRLDVLEQNLKEHVTNAKNEIKTHTSTEINSAKSDIKTHTTNEVDNAVSTINSHTTAQRTTLWNSISSSLSTISNTLSNIWSKVSGL